MIHGHRICKLKTLKIYYHGELFEMKVGSRTARADYTELYTTFEILIHILSKRFITFKSELLSISSTEIQYATEKGYEINDYSQMKKSSLKQLLLQIVFN